MPGLGQWMAVAADKIEGNPMVPKGHAPKLYGIFVYRDMWRKADSGWQFIKRESIGPETWQNQVSASATLVGLGSWRRGCDILHP